VPLGKLEKKQGVSQSDQIEEREKEITVEDEIGAMRITRLNLVRWVLLGLRGGVATRQGFGW
jgi:hypothetical protein